MGDSVRLCAVDEVSPNSAQRFDVDGHRIALIRIDDGFYAIGDRCSHADYSLSEGEVDPDDKTIECPKHGSTFRVTDGQPQTLPATLPVPVYDVEVRDGEVRVVLP